MKIQFTFVLAFCVLSTVVGIAPFYTTNPYGYYYNTAPMPSFSVPNRGATYDYTPSFIFDAWQSLDRSANLSYFNQFNSYTLHDYFNPAPPVLPAYYRKQDKQEPPEAIKRIGLVIKTLLDEKKKTLGDDKFDTTELRKNPPKKGEDKAEEKHLIIQLEEAIGFYATFYDKHKQ